ncbi:hypothetical protein BJF78_12630 [Pseudonocardia sp. CNS-139]|nr:hypothetical protein BJF78_12630 [Pseudonocardia sp. CNS-139]
MHGVIADWLTGRAAPSAFDAFAGAHHAAFTMITPEGALVRRDDLLPGFKNAHGSAPELVIQIVGVRVVHADATTVVATYEEWQDGPAGRTGRRSTVVFERDVAAPHGLRSRHLHETWITRAG